MPAPVLASTAEAGRPAGRPPSGVEASGCVGFTASVAVLVRLMTAIGLGQPRGDRARIRCDGLVGVTDRASTGLPAGPFPGDGAAPSTQVGEEDFEPLAQVQTRPGRVGSAEKAGRIGRTGQEDVRLHLGPLGSVRFSDPGRPSRRPRAGSSETSGWSTWRTGRSRTRWRSATSWGRSSGDTATPRRRRGRDGRERDEEPVTGVVDLLPAFVRHTPS
jgi:hypothetical protein